MFSVGRGGVLEMVTIEVVAQGKGDEEAGNDNVA